MSKTRYLVAGIMMAAFVPFTATHAAVVAVTFEGEIGLTGNPTFETIFAVTTISGVFTYETRATASPTLGLYFDALTGFSATIHNVPVGASDTLDYSASGAAMTVVNGSASGYDEFRLSMQPTRDGLTGSTLPLMQGDVIAINLLLEDHDQSVFTDANTPGELSLVNFEIATIDLSNSRGNAIFDLVALDSVVVPLPAALWLFLGAGAGLLARTRRVRC